MVLPSKTENFNHANHFDKRFHVINCCIFIAMMPLTVCCVFYDGFYTFLAATVI